MAITKVIGASVIDRGSKFGQAVLDYVVIEGSNPATQFGTIHKCMIYMQAVGGASTTLRFGTFYKINGNSFSCRAYSAVQTIAVGYNEFSNMNLVAHVGDYIGVFLDNNNFIELDTSGGTEYWYVQTSSINLDNTACTYTASYILSIGGEYLVTGNEIVGVVKIKGTTFRYVDAEGYERWFEGQLV